MQKASLRGLLFIIGARVAPSSQQSCPEPPPQRAFGAGAIMQMEWVYGVQPVLQVLRSSRRTSKELRIHRKQKGKEVQEILRLASEQGLNIREMDSISLPGSASDILHQGIILHTQVYPYLPIENLYPSLAEENRSILLLVLDQIQDPQNLGAILRTAYCAGVSGVVLPERGGALVNPTVLKTSAGAAEWLSIYLVKNIARTLEDLKEKSVWIYGAEMQGSKAYDEEVYPLRTALVMGSEGQGLRDLTQRKCDLLISIPLLGKINSLNVSVASGILLFEVLRQRKNKTKSP